MMVVAVKDLVSHAGVVGEARRRQRRRRREHRLDEAFALERDPHRDVAETARILGHGDGIADMKVVAMRLRQVLDQDRAGLVGRIKTDLAARLRRDGVKSVAEAVGAGG